MREKKEFSSVLQRKKEVRSGNSIQTLEQVTILEETNNHNCERLFLICNHVVNYLFTIIYSLCAFAISWPINLECGHGICFEQGNVDETDSTLTPRKMFGECVFLFALLELSFDTREHISNAPVLQHMSQMKKHRVVPYHHGIKNFISNPQLIWWEQQQQNCIIVTLKLLFFSIT